MYAHMQIERRDLFHLQLFFIGGDGGGDLLATIHHTLKSPKRTLQAFLCTYFSVEFPLDLKWKTAFS